MAPRPHPRPARTRRRESGFTLVELTLSLAVLGVAVLGSITTGIASRDLCRQESERGVALGALSRFVERLRADADWPGLYARLRSRSQESASDAGRAALGPDPALTTYAPTAYYDDLVLPGGLGDVTVLVQVPALAVGGVPTLREDQVAPRYGLPADLDGDGAITSASREADYRAIPIVARLRWQRPGQGSREVVLPTWLRGER